MTVGELRAKLAHVPSDAWVIIRNGTYCKAAESDGKIHEAINQQRPIFVIGISGTGPAFEFNMDGDLVQTTVGETK